jgi:mono/diheme cytochrome c family protein
LISVKDLQARGGFHVGTLQAGGAVMVRGYLVKRIGMTAAALAMGMAAASAQNGDPLAGARSAEAGCAECHAVANEPMSPDARAPSFRDIAATPGMTGFALNAALQTSHPNMPHLIIAPEDRLNLIAYILSLRE